MRSSSFSLSPLQKSRFTVRRSRMARRALAQEHPYSAPLIKNNQGRAMTSPVLQPGRSASGSRTRAVGLPRNFIERYWGFLREVFRLKIMKARAWGWPLSRGRCSGWEEAAGWNRSQRKAVGFGSCCQKVGRAEFSLLVQSRRGVFGSAQALPFCSNEG
jgi:hypothetical protein